MTIEFTYLYLSAMVTAFICVSYALSRFIQNADSDSIGIQSIQSQTNSWIERIGTIHDSAIENLGFFTLLLVLISITGSNNNITVVAAQLLFWNNVLHFLANITTTRWLGNISSVTSYLVLITLAMQLIN